MVNIERDRWDIALKRVSQIERQSKIMRRKIIPQTFSYHRRSCWSSAPGLQMLPLDQQYHDQSSGSMRARVRAEAVLIGKFDVQSEVRMRAFYPTKDLTLRYQAGGPNNGIVRTVDAYKHVKTFAPHLMPKIYDHGSILEGRGAYLFEDVVQGESASQAELESLILPLAQQFHAVHQGVGISTKTASVALGSRHLPRWEAFVKRRELEGALVEAVDNLHARNDRLEVSLTHGDLVNSNILVDGDDFILVDWEWSSIKPIAFDMAKMIINVTDIDKVMDDMHRGLGGTLGTRSGFYNFREQVALALVQTLTFYDRQFVKARKAKRSDALERQTVKRVNALKRLVNVD